MTSAASAAGLLLSCCSIATAAADDAQAPLFALVEGTAISVADFEAALAISIRQRFYHRRPREEQLESLRREVTERLVDRVLLLKEAQRRGMPVDEEKASAQLAAYEQRYRDQAHWQETRAEVLPALARALREQNMIADLELATRAVPAPAESDLRSYYAAHPEQFTEPERVRLSVILLKVDPSSPADAWDRAMQRAQDIAKQLRAGADFGDMARRYSDDASAPEGGDMGYRHRGMLLPALESEVDKMAPGAVSEPVRLLEGVAIFRLTSRMPARLRHLEEVRRAVAELWAREQGEARWRELVTRLRAGADIRFGDGTPLGAPASAAVAGDRAGH